MPKNGSYYPFSVALFLLLASCGLVSYQIYLIHLLSITQWNSFAGLVISIALLGYGAAGSYLTVRKQQLLSNYDSIIPILLIFSSIATIVSVRLALSELLVFDSYELFAQKKQIIRMLLTILLFTIPFFLGALSIGMIYTKHTKHISRLYAFDLLGAAVGSILILILINGVHLHQQLSVISSTLALSSLVFILGFFRLKNLLFLACCVLLIFANLLRPINISFSQFKSISYALDLPEAGTNWQKHSIYGFSQAVESQSMRYAPGLSLNYTGNIPSCKTLFNNGNAFGVYFTNSTDNTFIKHSTIFLPFVIKKPGKILLLDANPGLYNLLNNAEDSISIVVSNKNIQSYLELQLGRKIIHRDSRQFLRDCNEKFDLIILPTIGAVGGGIGMDAFDENHLLTAEAFYQLRELLVPGGIISTSAWIENPIRAPYRLLSLFCENEEYLTNYSILGIKNWGLLTFCYSNQKFTNNEWVKALSFINENGFDLIATNQPDYIEKDLHASDSILARNMNSIIGRTNDSFNVNYGFHLSAPTRNRPYFSQFLKLSILKSTSQASRGINPFLEVDFFIHVIVLLLVSFLALLLIIIPLLFIRQKARVSRWTFLYFFSLGMGFMMLEIVFIKVFSGYFFHPIFATTIVIGFLLLSSGLGSLYSSKFNNTLQIIIRIGLIISLLLLINALFLIGFIDSTGNTSVIFKLCFCFLIIGITGFFMGTTFPTGLKMLSKLNENAVPWAWGINGTTAVFASSATAFIIIGTGFRLLFVLAGFFYLLAAGSTYLNRYKLY